VCLRFAPKLPCCSERSNGRRRLWTNFQSAFRLCVQYIVSAYSMILTKCELLAGVAVSSATQHLGCFHCCYQFKGNSTVSWTAEADVFALCQEQKMNDTNVCNRWMKCLKEKKVGKFSFQFVASNEWMNSGKDALKHSGSMISQPSDKYGEWCNHSSL
jgi:hypothetical protein